jgi:uncharacterized protein (UPF0333 family)
VDILVNIVILIIVVLVAAVIGAFLGVSSYKKGHQATAPGGKVNQYTSFAQKFDANITTINWDIRTAFLTIEPGPQFDVKIDNTAVDQFNLTRSGHKLVLQQQEPLQQLVDIPQSPSVTITVPKAVHIEATQLNGTLKIHDVTLSSIDLNHLNGTTIITNTKISDGIITKKNGATRLDDVTIPGLRVAIKTGRLNLNGTAYVGADLPYDDGNDTQLDIQCTNGQVTVTTK